MTYGHSRRPRATTRVLAAASALLLGWINPSQAGVTLGTAALPGGSTYTVVADREVTWSQASAAAGVAGGHLAVITSAAEQAFVQQLLGDVAAPAGSYWIGLQKSGGGFGWTTGEPLNYTNWLAGQPDDNGGSETVGAILWSQTGDSAAGAPGTWNDLPDPYTADDSIYEDLNNGGYIVERSAEAPAAVPLPPAALLAPATLLLAGLGKRCVCRRCVCRRVD